MAEIKRIVICGGHLSPSLAIAAKLIKNTSIKCFYIGRKNTFEDDRAISLEYKSVTALKIPFFPLTTARFSRSISILGLISFIKFPVGILLSFWYLLTIRPHLVVSFGGYIALPVSLCAWALGIPVITHEQTHVLGLANRIIARFAKFILLTFKDTKGAAKGFQVKVIGLPLRPTLFTNIASPAVNFGNKKHPLIFITGGSSGATRINTAVLPIISTLTKNFRVLHQTGNAYNGRDYRLLIQARQKLAKVNRQNYRILTHIHPDQMGGILSHVHMAVARAGANTVSELEAFGVRSILIPLALSAENEQMINAQYLEKLGLALVIPEQQLRPDVLLKAIQRYAKLGSRQKRIRFISKSMDRSTENFISFIQSTLNG